MVDIFGSIGNAVGGVVSQAGAIWGGLGPIGQVAAVTVAAVGTIMAVNHMKGKEEEKQGMVPGGFAEREMQRRQMAAQQMHNR